MSKDNRRLGRGLEALLGKVAAAQKSELSHSETTDDSRIISGESSSDAYPSIVPFSSGLTLDSENESQLNQNQRSDSAQIEAEKDRALAKFSNGRLATEINVNLVDRNPFQPRLDFDEGELEELKESLDSHGLIQPIVVRQNDERYELIAGERRFRAAKECGWKTIPAIIFTVSDREMAELALTENIQRRDLNPIEKAMAFRSYLNSYGGTHEELAQRLSLDRSTVSNLMRLLELNEEVQLMTRQDQITMGHARALLPLEEWDQLELAKRIVSEQLSVRQTESIVKEYLSGNPSSAKPRSIREVSPRIQELEQQFRSWLGLKVKLSSNEKGKGKLVVSFNSNAEFERIYQMLKPQDF